MTTESTLRPVLDQVVRDRLMTVSTATLTTQLMYRGLTNCFIPGLTSMRPDLRMVGTAFTLRYVPVRSELGDDIEYDNRTNVQRLAIEEVGEGEVLVIDARQESGAASIGEILTTRLLRRGVAGLVTDGPVRDGSGIRAIELPTYCRGSHATTSGRRHHPADMQVPIGCGGVLVRPGDVVVGDEDGVVIFPIELAEEVSAAAWEQQRLEDWIIKRIDAGETIVGTYPPSREALERYAEESENPRVQTA